MLCSVINLFNIPHWESFYLVHGGIEPAARNVESRKSLNHYASRAVIRINIIY